MWKAKGMCKDVLFPLRFKMMASEFEQSIAVKNVDYFTIVQNTRYNR